MFRSLLAASLLIVTSMASFAQGHNESCTFDSSCESAVIKEAEAKYQSCLASLKGRPPNKPAPNCAAQRESAKNDGLRSCISNGGAKCDNPLVCAGGYGQQAPLCCHTDERIAGGKCAPHPRNATCVNCALQGKACAKTVDPRTGVERPRCFDRGSCGDWGYICESQASPGTKICCKHGQSCDPGIAPGSKDYKGINDWGCR